MLILIGALLLLANFGFLSVGLDSIGALFLVALGGWFLYGALAGKQMLDTESASIPLEGASGARVKIQHGAGRLRLHAGGAEGDLLSGQFGGGLSRQIQRNGDRLDVELKLPSQTWFLFYPFGAGGRWALDWDLSLREDLPLELILETGASATELDLRDLRVTELNLQTGASSTDVTLPAHVGYHRASLQSGAASIVVRVPEGVAARIHTSGGLSSVQVDTRRFPRTGDMYESPDFDTAALRADIRIETGVGSIEVN